MPENQQKPTASIVQITIDSNENIPAYSSPKNQQYPLTNATIPPQYLSQVSFFIFIFTHVVTIVTTHTI